MTKLKITIEETFVETVIIDSDSSLQEAITELNKCNTPENVRAFISNNEIQSSINGRVNHRISISESREEEGGSEYTIIFKDSTGAVRKADVCAYKENLKAKIDETVGSGSLQFLFNKVKEKSIV